MVQYARISERASHSEARRGRTGVDVSGGGRDCDDSEAGDGTGAEANRGPLVLALEAVIPGHPGANASCKMHGAEARGERRAAADAEPPEPERMRLCRTGIQLTCGV